MESAIYSTVAATVAFLIAILSGLGIGSGGLFVIWLTAIYGVSSTQARGMNLLFFVFSASAALILHFFKGRADIVLILRLAALSVVGTLAGVWAAHYVSTALLRQMFGAFLVVSGGYSLFNRLPHRKSRKN